jgi:ATP synthase F1 gamma subunit
MLVSLQVCHAGMKELRDRIDSIKNTKKITDAMKLVAAAKVRRAQDSVVKGRPFSENLIKVSDSPDLSFKIIAEHSANLILGLASYSSVLLRWSAGVAGPRFS